MCYRLCKKFFNTRDMTLRQFSDSKVLLIKHKLNYGQSVKIVSSMI